MKYHVFIGSTLDDLKNERREILRIIMELGHIPVMADYLDLTEKNREQLLQKTIEECDYFIALAAHKYAPLESEYNIAVKKNIPVIALVIDGKARWKSSKKEKEPALVKQMEEFKNKLRSSVCETWLNSTDLCQKCQSLLILEMNLHPQSGWVRANQTALPLVANELSRLSAENELLRRQINFDNGEIVAKLRDQMKQTIKVLALNEITLSFYYSDGENWENSKQFRHIRLFKLLAPEMVLGKTTAEISRFLGTVLNPDLDKVVRKEYPTPSNTIKKLMADFSLLKLVKCVNGGESSGDEVWEITEYGKELFSAYRMRQLEKGLVKKN
jgi:hypothetical protein